MSYYQIFIMATSNSCNVCFKRVLRHSYHLQCELCKNLTHLKCLPNVDKNSSIYVSRETSTWYCTVCSENIFPYNHIHDDDDFLYALSHNWDLPETVNRFHFKIGPSILFHFYMRYIFFNIFL